MILCLKHVKGNFVFKGSWRATAIAETVQDRATLPALGTPLPVPGFFCDYLYRRWCRCNMHITGFLPDTEGVERVDGQPLTKRTFAEGILHRHRPVMLTGLQTDWPAGTNWQADSLLERFGDRHFDITVPYGRVSMTMRNYLEFSEQQCDEDPLYLFDADFGSKYPEMLLDYKVPNIFPENLFGVLGDRQPPFRWFVMGPARSGASWHIDPFGTSAWNALVSGVKRWALYSPGQKPPGVNVWVDENNDVQWDSPSSLTWFLEVYPTLEPEERPLEVVQHPGEVIFVPGNWWHLVLNLEPSVAVTQNFAPEEDCDRVVRSLALGSAAGTNADAEERPVFAIRQGFMRDRILGPFLHQLAAKQLQDVIIAGGDSMAIRLADSYAARETWLDILRRAVSASISEEGWPGTQLPIAGGCCVVFTVRDVIYKFATKGGETAAAETWAEALASACLQRKATQLTHCTAQVLALGSVDPPKGDPDGPGATHAIPFVAMTACPGTALDMAVPALAPHTRLCIAHRLGRLTAQLHSLPLPDDRLFAASDAAAPRGRPFAFWQSRAGLDLSFRPSGAHSGSAKALLAHLGMQLQEDATDGTACVRLRNQAVASSLGTTDTVREAASECMSDRAAARQLWRPFAEFLRERHRAALWELVWEHSMPQRLLDQLDDYLLPDPSAFLPGSSTACAGSTATCKANNTGCSDVEHTTGAAGDAEGSRGDEGSMPLPRWVHGDLIAQNILVSEQLRDQVQAAGMDGLAHDAVRLIDFGDAGHGDPLYDLVLLLVKTFRCEVDLWEACLSATIEELGARPWWLCARGGVPLSRVAMTYTLLHEQDLASDLFKALPDLWRLRTLGAVEQAVFGQLESL
ncbi:probable bifunctional arginine demethylase and lysyl-hydroxylase JM at N-terminal half [Coccomyxa sp. Obi]|nr:probable bifunctional arginine demethylase and lysyl-hydroxylase JM at N-terminal half [Coccomyxa sp. Obi]